ncbi:MAG TPA: pirin family protein [Thermoanaerobaculia bacterium]
MAKYQRTVRRVVDTEAGAMGGAHRVRAVLEPGNWEEFDPFLLLMEDWFHPGTFGDHPHRGIETITYVIDGELSHRDNHGNHGVLRPGDAQWMTAGRGIIHSEEPSHGEVHSLQLWINLPKAQKMIEPRYTDMRGAEQAVRHDSGATVRMFAAPGAGHQPIAMVDFDLQAGARATQELEPAVNAFLYILSGSGRIGGTEAHATQVVWLEQWPEPSEVTIEAAEPLRAILWAGRPLREPVVAYGPFVMNTEDEIRQAYADFRAGKF